MKSYYTYILASKKNGTLYIGVTSDLVRRTDQHQQNSNQSFTQKYTVHRLVYFEETDSIEEAIYREKQLKHWNREWKIELIEKDNPEWRDLTDDL